MAVRAKRKSRIVKPRVYEEQEQEALAAWLNGWRLWWCHVPNETNAMPSYMAKRRRLGVQAGVPDVLIFDRPPRNPTCAGVAIELKRADGGRVSQNQQLWLEHLGSIGWLVSVCYGAREAIDWLRKLGYGE